MEKDEREHLQKKGRLCWRPVEDEHGNFATSDKAEYARGKNGSIRRTSPKKLPKKQRRLMRHLRLDALGCQFCCDCKDPIKPLEAFVHNGVVPLCKSCFDIRNGAVE